MYKRTDKSIDRECNIPAKRPKYYAQNEPRTSTTNQSKNPTKKKHETAEYLWGDDFGEDDIQEMDFIASQVSFQEETACTQVYPKESTLASQKNNQSKQYGTNGPSTSKGLFHVNGRSTVQSQIQSHHLEMEKKKWTNVNDLSIMSTLGDYREFEKKLASKSNHNSTFQAENSVGMEESEQWEELKKLRAAHKKLMNDLNTKEGETTFLRNRLQQTESLVETLRTEKTQLKEELQNQHVSKINSISKEKEALKTQLDMKALEIGNLMERCKLLENGQVKLTEPHVVNANFLMNKSKFNTSINRQPSVPKNKRIKDTSVQTTACNKSSYILKPWSLYYPLANIPKTVHDLSQPEECILDLHTLEKVGRKGSPMLEEQNWQNPFEKPELLRPIATTIFDQKLTTQFISQDIVSLQAKTESELESESCIPTMNKIVSTARELLLNLTTVLRTISRTIKSDDLHDYLELYSDVTISAKCSCDAKPWHSSERGIELRRVLGILSHLSLVSTYLSKYIAGKTRLLTQRDESYKEYSIQMTRYNAWSKKGHEFEMLEMFLELVTLVGAVRRSHQFSGVILSIAAILYNVNKKLGYCDKGLQYIVQIFKEIISLKPLPYCYVELCKVATIFLNSTKSLRSLCVNKSSCIFQNILTQLQSHQHDPITRIDITDSLLLIIKYLLHKNIAPLRTDRSDACNHCIELVRFLLTNLRRISEKNLKFVEKICETDRRGNRICYLRPICSKHCTPCLDSKAKCLWDVYRDRLNDVNFWRNVRRKQLRVLNAGLLFLSHLAICDPNVEGQSSEIEDSLHLFMQNISTFEEVGIRQNEREAIDRIKQTFMTDKTMRVELEKHRKDASRVSTNLIMEDRRIVPPIEQARTATNHNRSLTAINRLFTNRMM